MNKGIIAAELSFRTSRSSGAGGQHVNKTETRVEVSLDILASAGLTHEEKTLILQKKSSRINAEGVLTFASQKYRSQAMNKADATEKLLGWLELALTPKPKRIRTRPPKESAEERLKTKRLKGEKKGLRKKPLL